MSKNKKPTPIMFIGDKRYDLVVFRIVSRREDGTPDQLTWVGDMDTCELSKDVKENHFLVGYIPHLDYSQYAGEIPSI